MLKPSTLPIHVPSVRSHRPHSLVTECKVIKQYTRHELNKVISVADGRFHRLIHVNDQGGKNHTIENSTKRKDNEKTTQIQDKKKLKEMQQYDTSLNTSEYDQTVIGELSEDLHTNKCLGTIIGVTCGDILGVTNVDDHLKTKANLEQMDAEQIKRKFGIAHSFIGTKFRPIGQYTDDTEMTTALALSLVQTGKMNPKHCTETYIRFFKRAPFKGYGRATISTFNKIAQGELDYKSAGTSVFPEGSIGNGGVMRIAPVGLAFRNAQPIVLKKAVSEALRCSHVHPEAVDSAFLQALTIAHLCKIKDPTKYTKEVFMKWIQDLVSHSQITTEVVQRKLYTTEGNLQSNKEDLEVFRQLVPSGFQIASSEALALGLYAFGKYGITDPEKAVIEAVNWGGDADTGNKLTERLLMSLEGAIVGALCGALHGTSWIPKRWFDNILDNKQHAEEGKTFILNTAKQLATLDLTQEQDVM